MSYIITCVYVAGFMLFFFLFLVSSIYIEGERWHKESAKEFFITTLAAVLWPIFVIALIVSLFYDD